MGEFNKLNVFIGCNGMKPINKILNIGIHYITSNLSNPRKDLNKISRRIGSQTLLPLFPYKMLRKACLEKN